MILIAFVLYNVIALLQLDFSLMGPQAKDAIMQLGGDPDEVLHGFYFSKRMIGFVAQETIGTAGPSPVTILGFLELVGLGGYALRAAFCGYRMMTENGFKKWS